MYEIAVEHSFDAAHCLRDYDGSCRQLHGHTYRVRAAFRAESLEQTGLAVDFRAAKRLLKQTLDYLDHQYINDLPEFESLNPTAENIAKFIFDRVKGANPLLFSVSVWETPTSCATYYDHEPDGEL